LLEGLDQEERQACGVVECDGWGYPVWELEDASEGAAEED
jgi:hypothetical protein